MAGVLGVRPIVFLSLDGIAALLSVPIWVLIGFWFGQNLDKAFEIAKDFQFSILGILAVAVLVFFARRRQKARRARLARPTESQKNSQS